MDGLFLWREVNQVTNLSYSRILYYSQVNCATRHLKPRKGAEHHHIYRKLQKVFFWSYSVALYNRPMTTCIFPGSHRVIFVVLFSTLQQVLLIFSSIFHIPSTAPLYTLRQALGHRTLSLSIYRMSLSKGTFESFKMPKTQLSKLSYR